MRAYREVRRMRHGDENATTDSEIEEEIPMFEEESKEEERTERDRDHPESDVEIPIFENRVQADEIPNENDDPSDVDEWEVIDSDIPITSEESSDEEDEELDQPTSIGDELALWVNNYQVKHNAVDRLLKLLQRHGHSELPSTARTLLHTVRDVQVKQVSGMEYVLSRISWSTDQSLQMLQTKDGQRSPVYWHRFQYRRHPPL